MNCADCGVSLDLGIIWQLKRKPYCHKCFIKLGGKPAPMLRRTVVSNKGGVIIVE